MTAYDSPIPPRRKHFKSLDGLRGFCALWVVLGHSLAVTGEHSAAWSLLNHPLLAVDGFMALSGFLMLRHYQERQIVEPWTAASTWVRFWTRRLFRVGPLYYAAILVVLLFHRQILAFWDMGRPDLDYITISPWSVVEHVTFIFGVLPGSYWSRPLPDWSLSLEIQFYVLFPFIALLWAKIGNWRATLVLCAACLLITWLEPAYFSQFELPSPLPAKLPLFLSGMLIASWIAADAPRPTWLVILALAICALPLPGAGGLPSIVSRVVLMAIIAALAAGDGGTRWTVPRMIVGAMRSRPARFAGDVSYGVYLAHFPLLMIINATIDAHGLATTPPARLALLLAALLPSTYLVAWLGHLAVEQPGIRLGRSLLQHVSAPAKASPVGVSLKP